MRYFFIVLINFYQKYISPYKGFSCAYRCYHQTESCSARVKQIIAGQGVVNGWPLIKQQFADCRVAYIALQTKKKEEEEPSDEAEEGICESLSKECACDILKGLSDIIPCPDLPCDGLVPDLSCVPCNFSRLRFSYLGKKPIA